MGSSTVNAEKEAKAYAVFCIAFVLIALGLAGFALADTERQADACKPQLERVLK